MIISIIVFLIAITFHELAHGYTACLLGDDTAKSHGRLTLNPIAHIDLVGTLILPALLVMARSPVVFGWAKPVPVNAGKFANPRKGLLLTSLAGPVANFILAVVFAVIFKMNIFPEHSAMTTFLLQGVIVSLIFGIFNLMPIPPLDGSNILFSILPPSASRGAIWFERYGFVILIGLLYLGLFDKVIIPAVTYLTRVLVG